MELPFVLSVYHFRVGFKPILKFGSFRPDFEHGPKTKIAIPSLKESSNQKIEENKPTLKLNLTLKYIGAGLYRQNINSHQALIHRPNKNWIFTWSNSLLMWDPVLGEGPRVHTAVYEGSKGSQDRLKQTNKLPCILYVLGNLMITFEKPAVVVFLLFALFFISNRCL